MCTMLLVLYTCQDFKFTLGSDFESWVYGKAKDYSYFTRYSILFVQYFVTTIARVVTISSTNSLTACVPSIQFDHLHSWHCHSPLDQDGSRGSSFSKRDQRVQVTGRLVSPWSISNCSLYFASWKQSHWVYWMIPRMQSFRIWRPNSKKL